MNEHQPPEPDPEPLGAISFELGAFNDEEAAEKEKFLKSIAEKIKTIIDREDGIRKNTFVYRREKVIHLPDIAKGSKVCLVHYNDTSSLISHAAQLVHEVNPDRRIVGIDVTLPAMGELSEQTQLVTDRYRMTDDEDGRHHFVQYVYDEYQDTEIISDVSQEKIKALDAMLDVIENPPKLAL